MRVSHEFRELVEILARELEMPVSRLIYEVMSWYADRVLEEEADKSKDDP